MAVPSSHGADRTRKRYRLVTPAGYAVLAYMTLGATLILYVAAVLHEIGLFVSTSSHHKHSMYLVLNSELFGLTKKDVRLVALVARYHRKSLPKPGHPEFAALDPAALAGAAALSHEESISRMTR
jgi:exopolyphosphatase/pppGpp-phosphohydrolase